MKHNNIIGSSHDQSLLLNSHGIIYLCTSVALIYITRTDGGGDGPTESVAHHSTIHKDDRFTILIDSLPEFVNFSVCVEIETLL